MRRRGLLIAGLAVAAVVLFPRAAVGGTTDSTLQASVAYGYDSNPLDLNREVVTGPFEAPRGDYTLLDLDARLAHKWSSRAGYFLSGSGQSRLYSSSLEDADTGSARAEAGVGFIIFARGERKLSAAVRGSYGVERSTFVDPATGLTYVTFADPNTLVPIPDRFNIDVTSARVDLRLRTSRRLMFSLDSVLERQNYTDDYPDVPTLEPLDERTLTLMPGLRFDVSDRLRLEATATLSGQRYDALSALEEDATPAAGARRRYRTSGLRVAIRFAPREKWSFQAGLGGDSRDDVHAGYYDSTSVSGFVSASCDLSAVMRAGLRVSRASFNYDRATLDFASNGDVRGGDLLYAAATLERDFGGHLTLFGEMGTVRSDNRDPLYTYDRNWAHAGIRYRL